MLSSLASGDSRPASTSARDVSVIEALMADLLRPELLQQRLVVEVVTFLHFLAVTDDGDRAHPECDLVAGRRDLAVREDEDAIVSTPDDRLDGDLVARRDHRLNVHPPIRKGGVP